MLRKNINPIVAALQEAFEKHFYFADFFLFMFPLWSKGRSRWAMCSVRVCDVGTSVGRERRQAGKTGVEEGRGEDKLEEGSFQAGSAPRTEKW